MLNISDLTETHKKKNQIKVEIYEQLLCKCHRRIKYSAGQNHTYCYYTVPQYQIGLPVYNMRACILFIYLKLQKNGFYVKFYQPSTFYISWEKYVNNVETIKYYDKLLPSYKKPQTINQLNNQYNRLNNKIVNLSNSKNDTSLQPRPELAPPKVKYNISVSRSDKPEKPKFININKEPSIKNFQLPSQRRKESSKSNSEDNLINDFLKKYG